MVSDMDLDIVADGLNTIGKRLEKKWLSDIDVGQGAKVVMTPEQRKKREGILQKRKACIRNKKIDVRKYMDTKEGTINLDGIIDALEEITDDIEDVNLDTC